MEGKQAQGNLKGKKGGAFNRKNWGGGPETKRSKKGDTGDDYGSQTNANGKRVPNVEGETRPRVGSSKKKMAGQRRGYTGSKKRDTHDTRRRTRVPVREGGLRGFPQPKEKKNTMGNCNAEDKDPTNKKRRGKGPDAAIRSKRGEGGEIFGAPRRGCSERRGDADRKRKR